MKRYKYLTRAEAYADFCRSNNMLANKAGFLRREKLAPHVYDEYCKQNRDEAELIDAVFEDEALNAGAKNLSATVLSMYLKNLFEKGEKDDGAISVITLNEAEDAL
ncbi:MAG: hypothetical protein IKQ18_01570 [Clostridia bacterium]|nr:hypothetical protein [Clostridia bacterium]